VARWLLSDARTTQRTIFLASWLLAAELTMIRRPGLFYLLRRPSDRPSEWLVVAERAGGPRRPRRRRSEQAGSLASSELPSFD
jgi:hypothetical protein